MEAARKATAAEKQRQKEQAQAEIDAQNKAMKERIATRPAADAKALDAEVEAARKAVAAERLRQKEEINAHINAQNKGQRARIAQMKKDGGHTQADVSVSAVVFAAKLKSGVGGGLAAKLMASADGKAAAGGLAG